MLASQTPASARIIAERSIIAIFLKWSEETASGRAQISRSTRVARLLRLAGQIPTHTPHAMIDLTKLFYFVFGALTIAGGITGYLTKGSRASLIAGSITGILILVAAILIVSAKVQPGLILGGIVSLALAFQFMPKFFHTHKFMPAGMMTILSGISIVLTALALFKK